MTRRSLARALLLAILSLVISGCSGPLPLTAQAEHACAESAYVELINTGTQALRLEGWILRDNDGKYTLPTVLLAPQASLRIWRGAGLHDAANLYLAHPKATWGLINNDSPSIERPAFWPWDSVQAFFFACTVDLSR
jgi:hypothetical protein